MERMIKKFGLQMIRIAFRMSRYIQRLKTKMKMQKKQKMWIRPLKMRLSHPRIAIFTRIMFQRKSRHIGEK